MHHFKLILPTTNAVRPLFLTGAVCAASVLFWEAPAQCTMAVLACVFGFCLRRREPSKRVAYQDQSLQWW